MTDTLTARLLAEIERREDIQRMNMMPPVIQRPIEIRDLTAEAQRMAHADVVLAYLAALRKVVELHTDNGIGCCRTCGDEAWGDDYPCSTLRCVAEGLGVEVDG